MSLFERLAPGIGIYRELLGAWECSQLIDAAERASSWEAAPIGRYQDQRLVESRVDLDLRDVEVCDLVDCDVNWPIPRVLALEHELRRDFDVPIEVISRAMICKYQRGSHIRPHRDAGVYSTLRLITCVAYLNDSYSGGEIVFPQMNCSVRPKTGDCLCFYSEHLHGVDSILDGVRYSIVWFGEKALTH